MIYINNPEAISAEAFASKILFRARRNILFYKMSTNELKLDSYLKIKYHIPLKAICLTLLANLKVDYEDNNIIKFYFINQQYSAIARFITYGDGYIFGSKIWVDAFKL